MPPAEAGSGRKITGLSARLKSCPDTKRFACKHDKGHALSVLLAPQRAAAHGFGDHSVKAVGGVRLGGQKFALR